MHRGYGIEIGWGKWTNASQGFHDAIIEKETKYGDA
jgi:hypothetical protein